MVGMGGDKEKGVGKCIWSKKNELSEDRILFVHSVVIVILTTWHQFRGLTDLTRLHHYVHFEPFKH